MNPPQIRSFRNIYLFYVYVWAPECVYVHYIYAGTEEDVGYSGTGVRGGCESATY